MRQQTFRHDLYTLMCFSCFLYVLLLHPLYYVAQAEAQTADQKDRIAAEQAVPGSSSVYDCIYRLMAENSMERSAVTDIMLFDIVVAEAKKYPEGKIPPEEASADKFCEKHVFKEYKSLYDEAKGQRSARAEGTLSPPGQTAIETESAFLGYANNLTSGEVWGHSEITQDALLDLSRQDHQYQLSDGAILFLKQSSQSPDLYQWEKEVFHSHTPDQSDFPDLTREARISNGQNRLKQHISDKFISLLKNAKIGSTPKTLYDIGVIAHTMQDLVYHRGMTLNQHAGLAYAGFENPDYPSGDLMVVRRSEARDITKQMLRMSRELIGPCWHAVAGWGGLPGLTDESKSREFYKFARTTIGRQTIGYFSLIAYWAKSFPFMPGGSRRHELANAQQNDGLIQWDIQKVASEIIDSIRSNETINELKGQLHESCK